MGREAGGRIAGLRTGTRRGLKTDVPVSAGAASSPGRAAPAAYVWRFIAEWALVSRMNRYTTSEIAIITVR